jgi:opacity protein-like surface antigen
VPRRLKTFLLAGSLSLLTSPALAQTSGSSSVGSPSVDDAQRATSLATPAGHEVDFGISGYKYVEPGDTSISIHGPKFAAGYTGTIGLNPRQHWFLQANGRGLFGSATYDGWCAPFLITPDNRSPNGYALDLGDYSPCNESGDADWYLEGRALVGKDFIGRTWGWSPDIGLGIRHLSNGTTGVNGYRTDAYLYLPIGITGRTIVGAHHALSFNLEYDHLLHGWQKTRDSQLGGGDVPATPIAPAFTIDGFSDISFDQTSGWGLRAGAQYQMTRHWSVQPEYIHWNVSASDVNFETATFTVNGITARQQLGAYEPENTTNEFAVKLGFRF